MTTKDIIGKKIVNVRPMTPGEARTTGFYKKPFIFVLNDGSLLIPQSDDEGNDGGAVMWLTETDDLLFYTQ
jgi:hypothetical protein